MARRKRQEEHENHERWLVSYADFITLLFAFFVVMYSISSVNEGKYRVLSDSISSAFSPTTISITPMQVGQVTPMKGGPNAGTTRPVPGMPAPIAIRAPIFPLQPKDVTEDDWAMDKAEQEVNHMGDELDVLLEDLIEDEQISITRNRLWLEIEIKAKLLFASASATPSAASRPVLQRVASYLAALPNHVQVEGYTDNEAINTPYFPSNWELSSARAAAIVRLLAEYGVRPQRMVSVGYAEFRPIADNNSPEGRALNRRVVISLMADLGDGQDKDIKSFQALQQKVEGDWRG